MLPAERQKAILDFLASQGFASVAELGQMFSVSEMTIRRDLAELQEHGSLQRTYGGATVAEAAFFELSLKTKMIHYVEEKEQIAKAAAEMVKDGDTIILDAGSTTTYVAKNLGDKRLTVVTNAPNIVSELLDCRVNQILVAGGILRQDVLAIIGPQTEAFFEDLRADKLFLGVDGVDIRSGLTVPDVIEAHTKRAMTRSARRTIVLADHSKLGRDTLGSIIPLAEADCLITDSKAPEEIVEQLKQYLEVVIA
jgi:DeoR family fructose operon transcriptional repressor